MSQSKIACYGNWGALSHPGVSAASWLDVLYTSYEPTIHVTTLDHAFCFMVYVSGKYVIHDMSELMFPPWTDIWHSRNRYARSQRLHVLFAFHPPTG